MDIDIESIDYHRNGVGGAPFYVILFDWRDDDGRPRKMCAVIFENPVTDGFVNPRTAVLDLQHPQEKWRGDRFDRDLRTALRHKSERETLELAGSVGTMREWVEEERGGWFS